MKKFTNAKINMLIKHNKTKELVMLLNENISDSSIKKICYYLNINIDNVNECKRVFNKDMSINYDNSSLYLSSYKLMKLIIEEDKNWESHFNESNINFIKLITSNKFDKYVYDNDIKRIMLKIDNNIIDANYKKKCISNIIGEALKDINLELVEGMHKDSKKGTIDFIDIGSTGRGTFYEKSADFDYIIRLDDDIIVDEFLDVLLNKLNPSKSKLVKLPNKGFRISEIKIPGVEEKIKLDITCVMKRDSNIYSTDNSLYDRLMEIKNKDKLKYKIIISNIVYAKEYLKNNHAYKASHSVYSKDGGLGGVGVENWILKYNGSFIDAAYDFVKISKNKTFDEFKSVYRIDDPGLNFYTNDHDEYVSRNMTSLGYKTMKKCLIKFLKRKEIIKYYKN